MNLFAPVSKQLETDKQYGISSTYLLQYDAMRRDDFQKLFKDDVCAEKGVWLENCRELIEKVGLTWRGRKGYDWDWYVNVGFLVGYTPVEREKIIDEVFAYFKSLFGYFPEVAGSWLIDAYSMKYMSRKYGVKAFCICREQWATDAYTLWGGYYSGGYYPSENNMLCPAQSLERQIGTPVFRMLGIDPIYGYDELKYNSHFTDESGCWTMEPTWPSGKSPEIMDWYFKSYFASPCLSFAHATTGQENSFGWENFGTGYIMQIQKLAALRDKGAVDIMTLGRTGEDFCRSYASTPPQALVALEDWTGNGVRTAWYNCSKYRANLFVRAGKLFLRDLMVFDEEYRERYLSSACPTWDALYDNLPVVDSRLWSKDGKECGLFVNKTVQDIDIREADSETLAVDVRFAGSSGRITFTPQGIEFDNCGALSYCVGVCGNDTAITDCDNTLHFTHCGFAYSVKINGGICKTENGYDFLPLGGKVKIIPSPK